MDNMHEVGKALQEINGNLSSFANRLDTLYRVIAGPLPPMPADPTSQKLSKEADCHLERWAETLSCIARTERYITNMLDNLEQRVMDAPVSTGRGEQAYAISR